jgi:flagellar biogenesis protein FliO
MSGKQIRIIETVHLGPRKSVHLLKIGDKQILIGSTNENITKLADVMDESSGAGSSADQIDNNLGLQ